MIFPFYRIFITTEHKVFVKKSYFIISYDVAFDN